MNQKNTKLVRELYSAILAVNSQKEAEKFFRDLLTEKEIQEFSNRFLVAKMLFNNETYEKIEEKTGMSTRTIARISKWLKSGKGGYGLILKRISKRHNSFTRGRI